MMLFYRNPGLSYCLLNSQTNTLCTVKQMKSGSQRVFRFTKNTWVPWKLWLGCYFVLQLHSIIFHIIHECQTFIHTFTQWGIRLHLTLKPQKSRGAGLWFMLNMLQAKDKRSHLFHICTGVTYLFLLYFTYHRTNEISILHGQKV